MIGISNNKYTIFFHFYFFEKAPSHDLGKLFNIGKHLLKSDAGITRSHFLRCPEKRCFLSEVRVLLGLSIPDPRAQPAAPQVAPVRYQR